MRKKVYIHERWKLKRGLKRKGHVFQRKTIAIYQNQKNYEVKNETGFSFTHAKIDKEKMLNECIDHARSKLGGTDWKYIWHLHTMYLSWHRVLRRGKKYASYLKKRKKHRKHSPSAFGA